MYTSRSSFLSNATGTQAQWADAIRAHNAAQADEITAIYFHDAPLVGINADLALAQAVLESAWFTSAHWQGQFNAAGLGVTSATAAGPSFPSMEAGITAHLSHLCCYGYAAADCPIENKPGVADIAALWNDPRHFFHDGAPLVSDLERPTRKWAVPGTGYVESILAIANRTIGTAAAGDGPTQADIGFPTRTHWAADVGPTRDLGNVQWFVVHDTEGFMAGDENILTSPALPVESAHALIDTDGSLVFMVPLDTTAWTAGNDLVSEQAIQVELSGFAAAGFPDQQYHSLAAFFRWCRGQGMVNVPATYIGRRDADNGPLPDLPGIIGHQDVPDGMGGWGGSKHHTDPGAFFDFTKLVTLIG